jgi:hypothetical protein
MSMLCCRLKLVYGDSCRLTFQRDAPISFVGTEWFPGLRASQLPGAFGLLSATPCCKNFIL